MIKIYFEKRPLQCEASLPHDFEAVRLVADLRCLPLAAPHKTARPVPHRVQQPGIPQTSGEKQKRLRPGRFRASSDHARLALTLGVENAFDRSNQRALVTDVFGFPVAQS